jgi:hypothetical protein
MRLLLFLLLIFISSCSYKINNIIVTCNAPVDATFTVDGIEIHVYNCPCTDFSVLSNNPASFLASNTGAKRKWFDQKSNRWVVVF